MDVRYAPNGQQARTGYDPEQVKHEVLEVCDYYLRERRKEGRRYTYRCPECGGRRFEVEPVRGMAGCFSAECELPKTTDAIGIIGYMEDLDTRGPDFIECLKKGYEILGLDAGEAPQGSPGGRGGRPNSPKARSWIAGEVTDHEETFATASSTADYDQAPGEPLGRLVEAYAELPDGSRETLEAFVVEEDTGEVRISQTATDHDPSPTLISGPLVRRAAAREEPAATPDQAQREINHMVFDRLLGMCRLEERDRRFLEGRGLDEAAICEGRFGSISKRRSRYVTERLEKRFADEELLSVPGFYRAESGQLRFSLYGDYVLIPYYDADGYILTVEGRLTGEPAREDDPKYKALANSGVHLYVHPRFEPGEAVAFCEGAIGAMVAARCGLPVAAIKGMRNYRQPPPGRGEDYSVLPELAGVDFGGKELVYIPDLDVKPKTRAEAFGVIPEACEWLIERQGGRAKVAILPEGTKDLDEWLLSLAEEERVPEFMKLLRGAIPVEEWDPEGIPAGERAAGAERGEGSVGQAGRETVGGYEPADQYGEQTSGTGIDPGSGVRSDGADERRSSAGGEQDSESGGGKYRKATLLGDHIQVSEPASTDDEVSAGEATESRANLPAKTGADDDRAHGAGTEGEEDTPNGRRHTPSVGSGEGLREPAANSRLAASYPGMAFWYDVQADTGEQVEQKRTEATLRRWPREQQRPRRSRVVRLPKWDAGETAIAVAVSVLVAAAIFGSAYAARTRDGAVGLLGDLFTWPVWWIELALCLSLGLLAAEWIVQARYRMRRRQLAEHVGASGRRGTR